jgi:hypothetical protein
MATYEIEALKIDLPTAKDLAQFVYDKVGMSLDFIGKPKDEQYAVARNALEGKRIPSEYFTEVNPYLDKKELIPVDEFKPIPKRSDDLPIEGSHVHVFVATNMPHPTDPKSDRKVQIRFKKYDNGVITYQISGPTEQIAIGERINKFGVKVPEKYGWIDPRTEEILMKRADGTFTEKGRGLYAYCSGEKGGGIWGLIDKNTLEMVSRNITDPWA